MSHLNMAHPTLSAHASDLGSLNFVLCTSYDVFSLFHYYLFSCHVITTSYLMHMSLLSREQPAMGESRRLVTWDLFTVAGAFIVDRMYTSLARYY
jgi:hypothetical protein